MKGTKQILRPLLLLMLGLNVVSAVDYSPNKEPWRTLEREGAMLDSKVKVATLTAEEELAIPRTLDVETLAIKLVLGDLAFEEQMSNKSALEHELLKDSIATALTEVFGTGFPENELFSGRFDLVTVEPFENHVLVLILLTTHVGEVPNESVTALGKSINGGMLGGYSIRNGSAQIFKPVDRDSVLEVFVQLYNNDFLPGMDSPLSTAYLNMSDQMLHLIGTRFRNVFGESFYRMVVVGFYPSQATIIVRANVLLEPNPDNLYYASTIWYSEKGYVHLGTYPLLPSNVHMRDTTVVLKDYFAYLNDRTYRYPLRDFFGSNPFASVTVPCFIGLLIFVIVLLVAMRCCQLAAFGRDEDEDELINN